MPVSTLKGFAPATRDTVCAVPVSDKRSIRNVVKKVYRIFGHDESVTSVFDGWKATGTCTLVRPSGTYPVQDSQFEFGEEKALMDQMFQLILLRNPSGLITTFVWRKI